MPFFTSKKDREMKAKNAKTIEDEIQKLKDRALKDAKDVTLRTKKVNGILYDKTDDIVLNIFLATGGDRR